MDVRADRYTDVYDADIRANKFPGLAAIKDASCVNVYGLINYEINTREIARTTTTV